jgi:hypothetical protein
MPHPRHPMQSGNRNGNPHPIKGQPDSQGTTAMGQQVYAPSEGDRRTVFLLAASGMRRDQIADCVGKWGVDVGTLERHFSRELKTASATMIGLAMNSVMGALKRQEPWATTLVLKCKGGWSDNPRYQVEVSIGRDRNASLEDVDDMISQADTEERQAAIAEPGATTIEASTEVPDEQP